MSKTLLLRHVEKDGLLLQWFNHTSTFPQMMLPLSAAEAPLLRDSIDIALVDMKRGAATHLDDGPPWFPDARETVINSHTPPTQSGASDAPAPPPAPDTGG